MVETQTLEQPCHALGASSATWLQFRDEETNLQFAYLLQNFQGAMGWSAL